MAHSYGGVPGAGSVEGFERMTRENDGKEGGVIACVFIAAALPLKGDGMKDTMKGWPLPFLHVEVNLRSSFVIASINLRAGPLAGLSSLFVKPWCERG